MENRPVKVVIDTNLWVSMAMGSRIVSEQMFLILQNPNIEVFISAELIDELTKTLSKPRLRKYLSHDRSKNLFDIIWDAAQLRNDF